MLLLREIEEHLDIIKFLILFSVLLPETVHDIKRKEIWAIPAFAAIALMLCTDIFILKYSLFDISLSIAPGLILIAFALLFKKSGVGDGVILILTGLTYGIGGALVIFFFASIISGIYSLLLIIIKRKPAGTVIPFVPFITCGALIRGLFIL